MHHFKLLYDNIPETKVNTRTGLVNIYFKNNELSGYTLFELSKKIKYLKKFRYLKLSILFKMKDIVFLDKITCLIFDRLLLDLCETTNFTIMFEADIEFNALKNQSFLSTILYYLLENQSNGTLDKKKFIHNYYQRQLGNIYHYRRMVRHDEFSDHSLQSKIYSDVASVLGVFVSDSEWVDDVSETVAELVNNVDSHTISDCLIDIDINSDIVDTSDNNSKCSSINIAVMNFSDNNIFDQVKDNVLKKIYPETDPLYKRIYYAYDNHKTQFSTDYLEDVFFMVTAFQNHVSTRETTSGTGGTGLPTLVNNIINKTRSDFSYLLSGTRMLVFHSDYLTFDKDGFIGFNEENDYFTKPASKYVRDFSPLYIPGTIFLLQLIIGSEYENCKS